MKFGMVSTKRLIIRALADTGATFLSRLMVGRATVFMLHRFNCPDVELRGHDLGFLRQALEYLRRKKYELISLRELYGRVSHDGRPDTRAVAFTIDDGYFDHAQVAAPIFAEFDCPVTTFVTTGFLDGRLWLWWDQIEFVFESTRRSVISFIVSSKELRYEWNRCGGREAAKVHFTDLCKTLKTEDRDVAIASLAAAAEVDIPRTPPLRYSPMAWDALRKAERQGMEFGPHTVTHPILARSSDAQVTSEVMESWKVLRTEAADPVPVFCYPNGQFIDFGKREIGIVREAGMFGAVSGEPGYFHREHIAKNPDEGFRVRRFAFPDNMVDVIQYVSGIERAKQLARGGA